MGPRPLGLVLFLALGLSGAAAPLVRNAQALPKYGNEYPLEVYAGNFGGDAANDVLTVVGGHSIQVLINGAAGISGEPVISPIVETSIQSAAVGDLDGDGDLDVAVSIWEARQLVVYRNDGSATFTRSTVIAGQRAGDIGIGDFTGDGHRDLALLRMVAGSYSDGEALIFPGNGAGAFGAPVTTLVPGEPGMMRVVDANGDGKRDLLVAGSRGVVAALGNGNGTFALLPVNDPVDPKSDLATGDLNGDGHVDFAVISDAPQKDDFLRVFLNNGNGTFRAAGDYFGMVYFAVTVADVDADGRADLVGGSYAGNVAVLRGNGDGTFPQTPELWQSGHVWDLVAGDFNRDTWMDVVMLGGYASNDLQMIAGTGPGAFDAYRAWLPNGAVPYWDTYNQHTFQTTAADMNGDGAPDVVNVVTNDVWSSSRISVMLNANDGEATMLPPLTTETVFEASARPALAIGDINGDGKKDIVAVQQYQSNPAIQVLLGRGNGVVDALPPLAIERGGAPSLADLTGDGILDLVVTRYGESTVYRGTASSSFTDPLVLPYSVNAIGDLNGDGRADFVGHHFRDTNVAINNGNGTAFDRTILPDGDYPGVGALEDIDGDGHLDLLLLEYSGTSVRFGNGDGTFESPRFFRIVPEITEDGASSSTEFHLIRTGDFDGDGELDLVRGRRFYLGHGDGTLDGFAEVVAHWAGTFDVADFDGNGTDDLAVVSGDESVAIIRTGLGPDPTTAATIELAADPDDPQYAQSVRYLATLSAGLRPAGGVVFARDGVPFELRSPDALGDAASAAHPLGPVPVTATYTGDDRYGPATATVQHDVGRAVTTAYVLNYPASSTCGREIAVYASFAAPRASDLPGPSSGIIFREGSTPLQSRLYPGYSAGWFLIAGLATGSHTITAEFAGDANYQPSTATFTVVITPSLDATISAGSGVYANGAGYASAKFYSGASYAWTITNGTIDSGQGTPNIRYTAGSTGEVTLGLTITKTYCNDARTSTVAIVPRAPGATMFHLLTPCRVVDSRGGAPLADGTTRELVLGGLCGIPQDAKSLALNVTVLAPPSPGWLSLFASDIAWPGTSTINFRTGKTRANNSIVAVAPGARMNVRHSGPPVHFVIDVSGYFR